MADKRRKVSNRQQLLDFALTLPSAWQDEPWAGDVVTKVGTKIFVFFGDDEGESISVKLDESHAMAIAVPGAQPTGYGLGKHGWVRLPITGPDAPDLTVIEDWIEESYAARATKKLVAELIARNESAS